TQLHLATRVRRATCALRAPGAGPHRRRAVARRAGCAVTQQLCIELHDVAPATWPRCERLLALIDAGGRPPATLLAVPNYHGQGALRRSPTLVRTLQRRIDHGDEIVLHGYFHHDDAAPARSPQAWLRRNVLTAGEGEFAALPRDEAARRIRRGWRELRDLFCPLRG